MDDNNQITRIFASGGIQYSATVTFNDMDIKDIQGDAMSFYVWKFQRQVRDASPELKTKYAADGITMHASEVGKPVVDTASLIAKMSDDQATEAFEALRARVQGK